MAAPAGKKQAHGVPEARSKGRRGEAAGEQGEKEAAGRLREAEAQHKLRGEGKLELEAAGGKLASR